MKVEFDTFGGLVVTKEEGDPVFKRSGWALAESTFLYHVLQELKKMGYDCIKKRMWKDGHMVDDTQQYIRDRKCRYGFYNAFYAIFDAGEQFNQEGVVNLWR